MINIVDRHIGASITCLIELDPLAALLESGLRVAGAARS